LGNDCNSSDQCEDKEGCFSTRLTLLNRLKDLNDQSGWRDFFNTYWRLIYNTAIKAGLTHSEAEDAVQDTIMTVAEKIPQLEYDQDKGSFRGWLLNTTRWRVNDQFRKRKPDHYTPKSGDKETEHPPLLDNFPDDFNWDEYWEQAWQKNLMDVAIERVKQEVSPKNFQIFDLYVLKEWPISKISKSLGVSRGQIYLAKHRILKRIQKRIKKLKEKPI